MRNMLTRRNVFDDLFDMSMFHDFDSRLMRTDVKEVDNNYVLEMDLPGFDKKDIEISLEKGYLNVSATHSTANEEKEDDGRYIIRERSYGSYSRSFYVGEGVSDDQIKASYTNGTLSITVPKNRNEVIENKKVIQIENL